MSGIELVQFGDVEGAVISWLSQNMPGIRCATRRLDATSQAATPQIIVGATQSAGLVNMVTDQVQVIVQAYAADEVTASEMCQRARALVHAMARLDAEVDGVEVFEIVGDTSVYRFPDTVAGVVRYQCAVQMLVGPEIVTHTR